MNWDVIIADYQANVRIYSALPLMATIIGYVTKVLAVEMMFRLLECIGILPYIGWQDVIPRRAEKMATMASNLPFERLLDVVELFDRLDPKRLTR